MSNGKVLIIGSGHLAGRTKKLVADKGFAVTYLPGFANNEQDAEITILRQTEMYL